MRQTPERIIDPGNLTETHIERRHGVQTRREMTLAQQSGARRSPSRRMKAGDGSVVLLGDVRQLNVTGAGVTVSVTGDTLSLDISGGGGGTPLTVQSGDSTVDATVTTLDFDASDFTLTESPEDEINISLNYGNGAGQPAEGNHEHAGVYQPLDSDLTTIAGLVDPNADRILFWDESAGSYAYLTPGTNLSITGTSLDATGGGLSHGQVMRRLTLGV